MHIKGEIMYKFIWILMLLSALMTGCIKDQSDFIGQPGAVTQTSSIFGILQNEDGTPVEGAAVTFGGLTVISDIYGVYQFKNVEVSSERSIIRIMKEGYFETSRTFSTQRKSSLRLKNVLIKKDFSKSFNASEGGSIIESNITLDFPPNAIIEQSSGNTYSGQVQVAIKYLNPISATTSKQMPGDLIGLNDAQAIVNLAGYGMFTVELQNIIGLPLTLAKDQKILVSMKIPDEMTGTAPSTIHLWSYEDRLGLWKIKDEMTLNGSNYEGKLDQLNFWNCSKELPSVRINGRVTDLDGNPMAHVKLFFSSNNDNFKISSITDKEGFYTQMVPADKRINIDFNHSPDECSFSIFEPSAIGPFSSNYEVSDIRLNIAGKKYIHITADLISCAGQTVNNGYLAVKYNGEPVNYLESVNGIIDGYVVSCDDFTKLGFIGVNSSSNEKSELIEFQPLEELALGPISVCKEENDYITISIPELGYDTTTYTNVIFLNDVSKTLEASLPLDPPFFGINWTEGNEFRVSPGIYDLVQNEGYIALARQKGYDFYRIKSGKMTITQGANLQGKAIRGNFKVDMVEAESLQMIYVEGSFKATFN